MKIILIGSLLVCAHMLGFGKTNLSKNIADTIVPENEIKNDSLYEGYFFSAEELNKGVNFSVLQMLQGRVPGMNIVRLYGNDPIPNNQVQLHGSSTLSSNTNPLYIIDGIPYYNVGMILPENIESIQVLTNLSETAQYGIMGANGVIIINTKQNNSTRLKVEYRSFFYTESATHRSNFLSAKDWREVRSEWANNPDKNINYLSQRYFDYGANTNWLDEITQKKLSQSQNLYLSGGIKNTKINAYCNFNDFNSVLKRSGTEKFCEHISINQSLFNNHLTFEFALTNKSENYSHLNENDLLTYYTGEYFPVNIFTRAEYYNPTIPAFFNNGTYGRDTLHPDFKYGENPLEDINRTFDSHERKDLLANFRLNYKITKELNFSVLANSFKYSYNDSLSKYQNSFTADSAIFSSSSTKETTLEKFFTTKLNYIKNIGKHSLQAAIQYSEQGIYYSYTFNSSEKDLIYPNTARMGYRSKYNSFQKRFGGHFQYNYYGKYYLSLNYVKENNPFNGDKNKYLTYPSANARWVLSKENFFNNIGWISYASLNLGIGKSYHELEGEELKELNFGIDLRIFSDKLAISANHYSLTTDNLFYFYTEFWPIQVGPLTNKGWIICLQSNLIEHSTLKWQVNLNASYNKNKYKGNEDYSLNYFRLSKNKPIGTIYGYEFAGFDQNGRLLVFDSLGQKTNNLVKENEKVIGNGLPKYNLSFLNKISYKNFEFSFTIRSAWGFDILNYMNLYNDPINFTSINKNAKNYNPNAIVYGGLNIVHSSYFLEKGNYLKIDNVNLAYSFQPKTRYINTLKVNLSCNNVALFSKFRGWDPEYAGISGANPGFYYCDFYPTTRIFSFGIDAIF